jgi:hypothetical protein
VFLYLTVKNITIPGLIVNILVLLALFMPFSYLVDMVVYRMLWRRYEKERAAKRR